MTDDEQALIHFLIWHVRVCDLPEDVAACAARVTASGRYPRGPGEMLDSPTKGPFRVSLIPADDNDTIIESYPVAVGPVVGELLEAHPDFYALLVQRAA